jgi:hypothetical protein
MEMQFAKILLRNNAAKTRQHFTDTGALPNPIFAFSSYLKQVDKFVSLKWIPGFLNVGLR